MDWADLLQGSIRQPDYRTKTYRRREILHGKGPSGAFPFDKLIDGMLDTQMVEDTVRLIREAIKREKKIAVIINNCAGGNGPLIAQQIANRFLEKQC